MSPLISRPFYETDKNELNDAFNRFTRRSRTVKQFEWEWINTPEGQGSMWLLLDSSTGRIVGHHGLIPIKLNYFGRSILAGKTENTFLHFPYAQKGVYYPFEAKFIEEASERFDLLYTIQGMGAPGRVRQKLGYSAVSDYADYIKSTEISQLKKLLANTISEWIQNKFIAAFIKGLLSLSSLILILAFARSSKNDAQVKIDKITNIDTVDEKINAFWNRNRVIFGITPERNAHYIKWRIFDNPHVLYEFFLAIKGVDMVGYVITQQREVRGIKTISIIDIVADDNNEVIFSSILERMIALYKKRGIGIFRFHTLAGNNFLNSSIKKNGFVNLVTLRKLGRRLSGKSEDDTFLMAKSLNDNLGSEKIADAESWYYTEMLMEGVT